MLKATSIDFTSLLNELNHASLFELYRLNFAISNEINNPKRIFAIKQQLSLGMQLTYFDSTKNKLVPATLLEIKPKKALILDHEEKTEYIVSYYLLNIDNINTDIHDSSNKESTANNLKVGDRVGFKSKRGESIVGIIKRLNEKSVSVVTQSGTKWRVAYHFLYRIYDAELAMDDVLLTANEEINHE